MTTPLPLITPERAARMLADSFMVLNRVHPNERNLPPGLLLAMPPTWNNRYQALLYGEADARGYATMAVTGSKFLQNISWPGPIILHAHWFAGIFIGCRSEAEALQRFSQMSEEILNFRDRTNAKLIWTAHNIFPHGNNFPQTFLRLRQWIFENFDAIHVMHGEHTEVLEKAFGRKAKAYFSVPHMTYSGSHADCVSSSSAKVHYGVEPGTFVFGYFGSIQSYKNLDLMLEAFDRVCNSTDRPVAAIVAGVPTDAIVVQQLQQRWGADSKIRLIMKSVPDYEIQYVHRASDVMVLPYGETLNSGSAFMAASFCKPFIIPDGLSSQALKGLGAMLFDPRKPDALEKSMQDALHGFKTEIDLATFERLAPIRVSEAFFDQLDLLIGQGSAST